MAQPGCADSAWSQHLGRKPSTACSISEVRGVRAWGCRLAVAFSSRSRRPVATRDQQGSRPSAGPGRYRPQPSSSPQKDKARSRKMTREAAWHCVGWPRTRARRMPGPPSGRLGRGVGCLVYLLLCLASEGVRICDPVVCWFNLSWWETFVGHLVFARCCVGCHSEEDHEGGPSIREWSSQW